MHAGVPHGNAVTDAGNPEKERISACSMYSFFYEPLEVFHPDMPGDDIVKLDATPMNGFFISLLRCLLHRGARGAEHAQAPL